MAKKVKNGKLLRAKAMHKTRDIQKRKPEQQNKKLAFNNFATKVQLSKQKKIEKMSETQNRLIDKKRDNKLVRLPGKNVKKINKFALLDDQGSQGDDFNNQRLTHKGKKFAQMKHFNDMNFVQDDWDHAQFENAHDALNFHGFEGQQEEEGGDKYKSKAQIYKEIIDKSKKYKRQRQEQYEQNFEKAVELDQNYDQIKEHLKFRTQSSKALDKIQNTDKQYQKLMNELKQDERVVANRVVVNDGKGKEKVSKRKNQQLKQLLKAKNSDESGEDLRGWVQGVEEDSNLSDQQENSESDQDSNEQSDQSELEEEQDELDDIQLSSGDEQSVEVEIQNSQQVVVLEEKSNESEQIEVNPSSDQLQKQSSEEVVEQQLKMKRNKKIKKNGTKKNTASKFKKGQFKALKNL